MAVYKYVVKTKKGDVKQGKMESPSSKAVEEVLSKKDYLIINIEKEGKAHGFSIPFFGGISTKDKAVFIRQLATMLDAGIPMGQDLGVSVNQTSNKNLKKILVEIKNKVEGGYSLSKAMADYPSTFNRVFLAVVESGEETGKLPKTLSHLAEELEDQEDFNSKFKAAMIYPIFIFIALILVMGILMVYVIPQLKSLFASSDMTLPISTRILLSISGFVASYWWIILIVIVGIVYGVRYWVNITKTGSYFWDRLKMRLPVFGPIIEQAAVVRFTKMMSLLLGTGIPILKAIRLAARSVDNILYRDALMGAAKDVERGVPLSTPLEKSGVFPKIVIQMIKVGEEAGQVAQILEKLSKYYKEEVDTKLKMIGSIIEPVVIVILGIGIGFVVFSIIIPIYQISMGAL
jgi:type IV pilus assembly protein PilC